MESQVEQLQKQLLEQEKMASLGILSAGIAHEIQNPLNFVINFSKMSEKLVAELNDILSAEGALPDGDDKDDVLDIMDDLKENITKIVEHGERAISIIRGILLMSRGKENEFIPTDINRLVHEYVWLSFHAMRANHQGFNISIHEDYQDGLPMMMVIPQDLSRAVLNIMNNACHTVWSRSQQETADYQPTISITTTLHDDQLTIAITDNGEGMTPEVQQRIYENFFTTKPVGMGTGLGMGITRNIVEVLHGGKLTFESAVKNGTTFHITIPVRKP